MCNSESLITFFSQCLMVYIYLGFCCFFVFAHFAVTLSLILLKLLWFALLKILQLEYFLARSAKSISFSYFLFVSNDSLDKHLANCQQEAISPLSAAASWEVLQVEGWGPGCFLGCKHTLERCSILQGAAGRQQLEASTLQPHSLHPKGKSCCSGAGGRRQTLWGCLHHPTAEKNDIFPGSRRSFLTDLSHVCIPLGISSEIQPWG